MSKSLYGIFIFFLNGFDLPPPSTLFEQCSQKTARFLERDIPKAKPLPPDGKIGYSKKVIMMCLTHMIYPLQKYNCILE